jgi:hypothetical protein
MYILMSPCWPLHTTSNDPITSLGRFTLHFPFIQAVELEVIVSLVVRQLHFSLLPFWVNQKW